jgi:hypothetical protein
VGLEEGAFDGLAVVGLLVVGANVGLRVVGLVEGAFDGLAVVGLEEGAFDGLAVVGL